MEITTIVLEGILEHKDSMGITQQLKSNEVQVMSAGTGIFSFGVQCRRESSC